MTERGNEFSGFAPGQDQSGASSRNYWSRAATALFVVGLAVVAVNSALYFFGVEMLSHPAASLAGLTLLVPRYLEER
jgi:hypothetical protein